MNETAAPRAKENNAADVGGQQTTQGPVIETVAGTGTAGNSGDGQPAILASLDAPEGLSVFKDGSYLTSDWSQHVVRRVDAKGVITRAAGGGTDASANNKLAKDAKLAHPGGSAILNDGSFLIADEDNNLIRRVYPDGNMTTVAGGGTDTSNAQKLATHVQLQDPVYVAVLADGRSYLIVEWGSHRVRKVDADGYITTVAGNGTEGFSPDGTKAVDASLHHPLAATALQDDSFLVSDTDNNVVRHVDTKGVITTVAGGGTETSDTKQPARQAKLAGPQGLAAFSDGSFLIADRYNARVRLVKNGVITTAAGGGTDTTNSTKPATRAKLGEPVGVALIGDHAFLISDTSSHRVFRVSEPPAMFRVSREATLSNTSNTEIQIACPSGAQLISGGVDGHETTPSFLPIISSYPSRAGFGGSWRVVIGKGSGSVIGWALCENPLASQQLS